jgi:bifunctional UDP-N-acetylglucosamine pyrophosphorylase/glucosamine-1-phosphate N-acetyltransferase
MDSIKNMIVDDLHVFILAGGHSKKNKSSVPRPNHCLKDKPLIHWMIDAVRRIRIPIITMTVIVNEKWVEETKEIIDKIDPRIKVVPHVNPQGNGHAIQAAIDVLNDHSGTVLIIHGDIPLIKPKSVEEMWSIHTLYKANISIMTAVVDNPKSYGRILRDEDDHEAVDRPRHFCRVKEDKECNYREKRIDEINCGIYLFDSEHLKEYAYRLDNNNSQKEYYLSDLPEIYYRDHRIITIVPIDDPIEVFGVYTSEHLNSLEELEFLTPTNF